MNILDNILSAPDDARISILYPCTDGRGAESIGDAGEARTALDEILQRLALRAKTLTDGIDSREHRCADKADFLGAFEHELFGKDEKLGRRARLRMYQIANGVPQFVEVDVRP